VNIIIENGLWETDFLLKEILPKGEVSHNLNERGEVFIFASRAHLYDEIVSIVKKSKPKIIICLSDELIAENLQQFNQLGNYCDLFLRQYHHPQYTYTSNTIHIPLGYTNGCEVFNEDKVLNWSFLGEIKNDREEMLSAFYNISKHFVGKSAPKNVMCKIYSKSIFVPCGRGNSSLECFRLYEASMNGAIPIVVGDPKEIKSTFKYENNPPWIYADSWQSAFFTCKSLLNNTNQLKEQQKSVLNWWDTRINDIKNKVLEVL
jgi:hypothetical protein